jgi:beta-glucosidase
MEISSLPIEEKAKILTGSGALLTSGNYSINLPALLLSDGPHGIRRLIGHPWFPQECSIPGGDVCFPTPSALGSTWNIELVKEVGKAIARDCIEEDIQVLLAPGVNMKRTPVCGRNFEYFSEDPVLSGELGAAFIQGVQSLGVSTSLKHFAVNNQEKDRNKVSVEIDMRTLREIYLLPFEIAVKKGQPDSVMCAYNKLGGIWCSEHKWLLTELLREEWGFGGLVISDWYAVHSPAKALRAGLDLQMPKDKNIVERIKDGLARGIISEAQIDQSIERIRRFAQQAIKCRGLKQIYDRASQHRLAVNAAAESIVLLKNDNDALPLCSGSMERICIIGSFAQEPVIMGGGSSKVTVASDSISTPLECIRQILPAECQIDYLPIFNTLLQRTENYRNIRDAAKQCDTVIVFIANPQDLETEGTDRECLAFADVMNEYADLTAGEFKRTIVVMQTGSANIPGQWRHSADAVLQMWYAGEGGGEALAKILFGQVNPSGKLSETLFLEAPDYAYDTGNGKHVRYQEGSDIGYRYYDKNMESVWFPFGHGLSYTRFSYEGLEITNDNTSENTSESMSLDLRFVIKNNGDIAGQEVWQLYVGQIDSIVYKPIKELKAFAKVFLAPGEEKIVEIRLGFRDFAHFDQYSNDWKIENGKYMISVGASAADIRLGYELVINDPQAYTILCEREALIL